MLPRLVSLFILVFLLALGPDHASAQAAPADDAPVRVETGGAQTLEDILARQRGEKVDDAFRRDATGDPDSAAAIAAQLGTLGGASDAEVYRSLRYGTADVTVSSQGPADGVLVQDGGMRWLELRNGPLPIYGGYLLLGMLGASLLFFLLRGKIRIEGEKTGRKILRFSSLERFSHWLMAGSFILLALTGLISLFGRMFLIPLVGKGAFATLAEVGKWIHNNVSWAFIVGLALVFFLWVLDNFPKRSDLVWLAKGGGLFTKGVHPPAGKFNAGEKIVFWTVILLGVMISLTGLSLLFPFQIQMFAPTFQVLNDLGLPQLVGLGTLNTDLALQEEMQYAQLWHAVIAFVYMAVIFAHIYLGSVGMEGAYAAMTNGEVEEQWAREHHSLWLEEIQDRGETEPSHTPAE